MLFVTVLRYLLVRSIGVGVRHVLFVTVLRHLLVGL